MSKTVFETLEDINKAPREHTVQALRATYNPRLNELFVLALRPDLKMDVPGPGAPYKPCTGEAIETLFWQELRKLYIFYKTGAPNLTDARRQELFIQMLENIHPKDAEILIHVKDKTWPYENITIETVNEAFPGLIKVPELTN